MVTSPVVPNNHMRYLVHPTLQTKKLSLINTDGLPKPPSYVGRARHQQGLGLARTFPLEAHRWVRVSVGTGHTSRARQSMGDPRAGGSPQPISVETRQELLEPKALVWISNPTLFPQKQLGQTFQI